MALSEGGLWIRAQSNRTEANFLTDTNHYSGRSPSQFQLQEAGQMNEELPNQRNG